MYLQIFNKCYSFQNLSLGFILEIKLFRKFHPRCFYRIYLYNKECISYPINFSPKCPASRYYYPNILNPKKT